MDQNRRVKRKIRGLLLIWPKISSKRTLVRGHASSFSKPQTVCLYYLLQFWCHKKFEEFDLLCICWWCVDLLHCFFFFFLITDTWDVSWKFIVKTEKKTVQFSEDIQVETIEPEQEPVFIDEVGSLLCALFLLFSFCYWWYHSIMNS